MDTINYDKYLVKQPLRQGEVDPRVKNRTFPPLTYMSSALVPEVKYNVEFSWVWGMPEPNPYLADQVSDYDEVIVNIGGDCRNPEDLGAEIEYVLGDKVLKINHTSAIFVPRGVKHGPLTYKNYRHPHVRVSILLGTGERKPGSVVNAKQTVDYELYLVEKPIYEVLAGTPIKNRQGPSSMTLMSKELVPECDIYVEGGWAWGMPDPNPHIFEHEHAAYEELVLHFGTDYENPEELGAEIEFGLSGYPLKVDKTSVVYVPFGLKHGPLTWKKYVAPHFEMAIIPGAGNVKEADPGGHIDRQSGK